MCTFVWQVNDTNNMDNFPLISHDGLLLAGYHSPSISRKSPHGLLILIHGLAEHSGRYEYLVEFYNKNNFLLDDKNYLYL